MPCLPPPAGYDLRQLNNTYSNMSKPFAIKHTYKEKIFYILIKTSIYFEYKMKYAQNRKDRI